MSFIDAIRDLFGDHEKHQNHATVTVREGDSLWRIAERITGDGENWRQISDVNPGLDKDYMIQPGQKLNLPLTWADDE